MSLTGFLLAALALIGVVFAVAWFLDVYRRKSFAWPKPLEGFLGLMIGFWTNFFDTLGIGSFAPTTALFKFFKLVPDERIPGTLNAGHALPTVVEALIFITIVSVDPVTLLSMIAASMLGAWLGAGVVARLPRRAVQIGMGIALLIAAGFFVRSVLGLQSSGGTALGISGTTLVVGLIGNFCLGALMTLGIGLYAPCLILVSLLGMNPLAAFPIMMGSCAFLMPIASYRFIKLDAYSLKAALGLTIGGIPAVIIAAKIVKKLDLHTLQSLVIVVVLIAAISMLRSAYIESRKAAAAAATQSA